MARWGLLNLCKPAGLTSRQVVDQVQRLAGRAMKVGHAGTLDPLASGVLVTPVGRATRLTDYVQQMPKTYSATFLLGRQSDTEDTDGEVTELVDPPIPTANAVREAAERLTGRILQRPPAYSAIKVGGRRAYDLAKRGEDVRLAPREVDVYRLNVVAYEYPELRVRIECGGGTYVRSLGRDLAESLGTAAVMSSLQRTAIGPFRIEEAVSPESLTKDNWTGHLLPPIAAVSHLPQIVLGEDEVRRILSGRTVHWPGRLDPGLDVAGLDPSGRLVSIMAVRNGNELAPKRNFPPGEPLE